MKGKCKPEEKQLKLLTLALSYLLSARNLSILWSFKVKNGKIDSHRLT